ncbi:MAG: hypothetical protein HW377_305 [Actinobacteria bacterium]|nr:hypothetical protein [Actinomycetota bacterium]
MLKIYALTTGKSISPYFMMCSGHIEVSSDGQIAGNGCFLIWNCSNKLSALPSNSTGLSCWGVILFARGLQSVRGFP